MKKFSKGFLLVLFIGTIIFTTKVMIEMAIANRRAALDTSRTQLTKKTDLLVGYTETTDEETLSANQYQLPVPVYNQLSEPALEFGCEVTALSMLLAYYHLDFSKNELADKITKEPYKDNQGFFGDPDVGFVGDITGKNLGTSVNVNPIIELTRSVLPIEYTLVNSTGEELDQLLEFVQQGNPVWLIVTTDYEEPDDADFMEWPTRNGNKIVSRKHHAAVISGFNDSEVFLNDPYGKVEVLSRSKLATVYQAMGSQSFYIK